MDGSALLADDDPRGGKGVKETALSRRRAPPPGNFNRIKQKGRRERATPTGDAHAVTNNYYVKYISGDRRAWDHI